MAGMERCLIGEHNETWFFSAAGRDFHVTPMGTPARS
jgi:hypothetical protein